MNKLTKPTTNSISLLPYIDLQTKSIPESLLNIIPQPVSLKYSAVFFAEDESGLKLAIGHPEKLKNDIKPAIERISKKLNKKINLYSAHPAQIENLILGKKPLATLKESLVYSKKANTPSVSSGVERYQTPEGRSKAEQNSPSVSSEGVYKPAVLSPHPSPPPPPPPVLPPLKPLTEPPRLSSQMIIGKGSPPPLPAKPLTAFALPSTQTIIGRSATAANLTGAQPSLPIKALKPPSEHLPKLYIQGEIPFEVLNHIPFFFSQIHRILCVDFVPPNKYTVAIENTSSPEADLITNFLKKNNPIDLRVFAANSREIDYLLKEYQGAAARFSKSKTRPILPKFKIASARPPTINLGRNQEESKEGPKLLKKTSEETSAEKTEKIIPFNEGKIASDVIRPDVQGGLISGEKAKSGFGATVEKISSLFSTPKIAIAASSSADEEITLDKLLGQDKRPTTAQEKPTPVSTDNIQTPAGFEPVKLSQQKVEELEKTEVTQPQEAAKEETKDDDELMLAKGENLGKLLSKDVESLDELKAIIKQNSIPKIVAALVSYAISLNASDVHAEPFEDEVLIRYRIDGQLRQIVKLPPDMQAPLISRIKILSRLKLDETRIPQDGRFDVVFSSREVDLRVSTFPAVHGEKAVLRILDKSKGVISLESLGLEGRGFDNLIKAINKPYGIIMATGPTGSGKSTTLYAVLARVATTTVNVITLEDPVEYEMKGINQSQINPKIGYTFADGLRSILRQDPNIIMVGEVRDSETANMATQAALTGHLVLTTLHTNDASGALPRLVNMGIEPFLITSSINAIIGQRLVRKVCQNCKEPIEIPAGVVKGVEEELAKIPESNLKDRERIKRPFKFFQGKGCNKCNNSGYSGRIGVYEILPMSEKMEELTIEHASATQILTQATAEGMITMKQDGLLKVLAGVTALDEVLKETSNK